MVSERISPSNITFEGLPWPIKGSADGRSLGLGGTTSLMLPDGALLMTAIVRWAPPLQPPCPKSDGAWRVIVACNRSSVVVFRSADGVRWSFLSVLADAPDHPESFEGPSEHDITYLPDGKTLLAIIR